MNMRIPGTVLLVKVVLLGVFICPARAGFSLSEAAASGTETDKVELERIVVTPLRLQSGISDTPDKVTVIPVSSLSSGYAMNIDDLLKDVNGVDVSRRTGLTSSTSTVTLRGFGGQARGRTLVLVDGIPFNEIYSGEVYWNAIPMEDVERIEVVSGAGSALYGPGAMGGVINIITRDPSSRRTSVSSGYGSFATRFAGVSHEEKMGNFSCRVSGNWFKTDGYVAVPSPKTYDIRRDKENYNANVKLSYDMGGGDTAGMNYRHYEEDVNGGRKYYYGSNDMDNLSFNLRKEINGVELLGTFYLDRQEATWVNDKSPSYTSVDYINKNPKTTVGGNLQTNIHLNEANLLAVGGDIRSGRIASVDNYKSAVRRVDAKGQQDSLGLYLQDEIKLADKAVITLGGRWDYWRNSDGSLYDDTLSPKWVSYDSVDGSTFSPKLGVMYRLSRDTTFRATAGKSFRIPTLYDLYRTWKSSSTTYRANPNLKPEKAYCFDAGVEQKILEKITARVTFYYNDVDDLIYSVGESVKDKQNVGKVEIYGLETELSYAPFEKMDIFLNHTFNSSRIVKHSDASLEDKYLTYTPEEKWSFGCLFFDPKLLDVRLTGRYTGSVFSNDANTQKLDGYFIWDVSFSRKIGAVTEISLSVDNLQDRSYQEYRGVLAPGRTVIGSVKVVF